MGAKKRLIATILFPVPVEIFFSDYWEKKILLITNSSFPFLNKDNVDDLLKFSSLNNFNSALFIKSQKVRISTRRKGSLFSFTSKNPEDIKKAIFEKGCSLMLSDLHLYNKNLSCIINKLNTELFPLKSYFNLFISPPGAVGLLRHFDREDILIIQISGSKIWHTWLGTNNLIYATNKGISTNDYKAQEEACTQENSVSYELKMGDILYLPRGTFHAPETHDECSIHLNLSFVSLTKYDIVRDIATSILSNRELINSDDLRKKIEFKISNLINSKSNSIKKKYYEF